uniref:Alpha kinase 1 n=1 Tax=Callorhinchus milii TaxID=7868 RepID=A0A4W3HK34_CALMI|eukprot:gi/632958718/ref/XP_007895199.1/ PREDICTED: alpha-protein kinase 1 [Callorhinchus milii]
MNNQEVEALLQECKRALDGPPVKPSEEDKTEYQRCKASLSADLKTLLEQAKEMKWPFVPERWQYKQVVGPEDKTNLKDIISEKLPDLLVFLKAAISLADYTSAAATVFLIDRFVYWVDASSKLLQVAKGLHKRCLATPIAPQVVLRQARVSVNSGKLLKAEYILSSLINNTGATGTWVYEKQSDCVLVQAVSLQIRGQILQKLGLWYEAAELTWASIVGFYELPHPDKKGISTSLGILADILVSMSDKDYNRFKHHLQTDLILLEECAHRLLSAAEAAKLAAVLSQYNPLFVLTNMNICGTCLLSYSFKNECPEEKQCYLSQAKEAFEIGLLTKRDGEVVTSMQELHGLVKAAFSLATVQKWLTGDCERHKKMRQMCKEAMQKLYLYSAQAQETLAGEIMTLVNKIKVHLQIKDLCNSDSKSYVPDHYTIYWDKPIVKGRMTFNKVLEKHSQYHTTICTVFQNACRKGKDNSEASAYACITALKTDTKELDTAVSKSNAPHPRGLVLPPHPVPKGPIDRQHGGKVQQVRSKSTASKSEKQNTDPSEDSGSPHCSLGNDPPNVSTDAKAECENLMPEYRDSDNKDCLKFQSDNQGYSAESWMRVSGSESPNSWEKVTSNECCSLSRVGENQRLRTLDTQCSTALTEDVGEQQPNSHNQDIKGSHLQNSTLQSITQSVSRLSLQHGVSPSSACSIGDFSAEKVKKSLSSSSSRESGSFEMVNFTAKSTHKNNESKDMGLCIKISDQSSHFPSTSDPNHTTSNKDSPAVSVRKTNSSFSRETGSFEMVDPAIESADAFEGDINNKMLLNASKHGHVQSSCSSQPGSSMANTISVGINVARLSKMQNGSLSEKSSSFESLVDSAADTVADTEESTSNSNLPTTAGVFEILPKYLDNGGKEQENQKHCDDQRNKSSAQCLPPKEANKDCNETASTEADSEDEGDRLNNQVLNRSHNSSSSFQSWCKSPFFSSSGSDLDYMSVSLSSSSISFEYLSKRNQTFERRVLTEADYKRFFAGINHDSLIQRLKGTGVFPPDELKNVYTALLFKYGKKTDTWTAQETLVYIGKPFSVEKAGAQRTALEIRFLHQEQILGRYVGKQYKKTKELSYHFNDVERQMTAQYYVTEFNKKLYEQQVPTQIYYIPATVLMLLEDEQIVGCISVEPYMLGEFVKLTNNTNTVRREYEATMYGLAFGHFTYEFSKQEEIVVDLQGWITGDGKGLLYLTDPQIHSVGHLKRGPNFGNKGIQYFLNDQHEECNEICRILSLNKS